MNDGIVVYRSEYARAVDQLMFRDGGALFLLLVFGAVALIAFVFSKWESWRKQQQARKSLLEDD